MLDTALLLSDQCVWLFSFKIYVFIFGCFGFLAAANGLSLVALRGSAHHCNVCLLIAVTSLVERGF